MISKREVYVYRELYYEHYKPLARIGCPFDQMENIMEHILNEYGWTMEKFKAFQTIDIIQRLKRFIMSEQNVTVYLGDQPLTVDEFINLPKLRCPIRSEQRVD